MIEFGPSIRYIYQDDGSGSGGLDATSLRELRGRLRDDIPEAVEMDAMLTAIIGSNGSGIVEELAQDGKFLLGANYFLSIGDMPDGLLYVEGEKPRSMRAYRELKMGIWVAGVSINNSVLSVEECAILRDSMLDLSFNDSTISWGIPVERTTIITPIHPQPGDIAAPFAYGHRSDMQAIDALDVPEELKAEIAALVQAEHQLELARSNVGL